MLTLAEADSTVMRMFDVLELSLQDGTFGPNLIPVVSWIDGAPHRERILLKAVVWLYEQGMDGKDYWMVGERDNRLKLLPYKNMG